MSRLEDAARALLDHMEGVCRCPCCEGVTDCSVDCTFSDDAPASWARMVGDREAIEPLRAALRPGAPEAGGEDPAWDELNMCDEDALRSCVDIDTRAGTPNGGLTPTLGAIARTALYHLARSRAHPPAPSPQGLRLDPALEGLTISPRDMAVWIVDALHGYTCEASNDKERHRAEYDDVERLLSRLPKPAPPARGEPDGWKVVDGCGDKWDVYRTLPEAERAARDLNAPKTREGGRPGPFAVVALYAEPPAPRGQDELAEALTNLAVCVDDPTNWCEQRKREVLAEAFAALEAHRARQAPPRRRREGQQHGGQAMSVHNDGGPAFPTHDYPEGGMTLRDYFAAKAMQAMVSTITDEDAFQRLRKIAGDAGLRVSEWISRESYKQADAMLAARPTTPEAP